ncbi:MAG: hypothetical protein M3Y29_08810 [Chloroflexota bacterium]|nr:hypothetical protein [Chloroflexota bacterium]
MSTPEENTQGREAARKALAESRRSSAKADRLIADTRAALDAVRASRERNHFADKFRAIIRGAA